MKKKIYIFMGLISVCPFFAFASPRITEIMYDPKGSDTDREWVEIYNDGPDAILLTDWKLFTDNTNHKISEYRGSGSVPGGSYVIIAENPAKFVAEYSNYTGTVFDSSFDLGDSKGEKVALRDKSLNELDTVTYDPTWGGNDDGNSLQRSGTTFAGGVPNPGTGNETQSTGNSNTTPDTQTTTGTSTQTSSTDVSVYASGGGTSQQKESEVTLSVTGGKDRLWVVGSPIVFKSRSEQSGVTYLWTFGDGSSADGNSIAHTYLFPGDYIAILNAERGGETAVSRVKVRIVPASIAVKNVLPDGIELQNTGSTELNLQSFHIETPTGSHALPQDTIFLPRTSVVIPFRYTKINRNPQSVAIVNPDGMMVSHWERLGRFATSSVSDTIASIGETMPAEKMKDLLRVLLDILSKK